jgi:hypothetical protein
MTVSNIALAKALGGLGQVSVTACYQPTTRVAGTISYSPATPGVFTLTNPPFVLTDWLKVEVASPSLPSELAQAGQLYIRPVPGQPGKVYLYQSFGYSPPPQPAAAIGLNPTAAFSGQIMDSDITQQRSVAAVLAAYSSSYSGAITSTGSFGNGGYDSEVEPTPQLASSFPKPMSTNTSGTTKFVSHMLVYAAPYYDGESVSNDGLLAIAPVQGQINIPSGVAPQYLIKATVTKL